MRSAACRYNLGVAKEKHMIMGQGRLQGRHVRQVQKNCEPSELTCRRRQRQALLHWAYDSRKI